MSDVGDVLSLTFSSMSAFKLTYRVGISSISDHLQRVRPAQYLDRQTNRAPANSENALSRPRATVAVIPPGSKLPDHARERVDSIAPVESEVAHRQQTSRRCVVFHDDERTLET